MECTTNSFENIEPVPQVAELTQAKGDREGHLRKQKETEKETHTAYPLVIHFGATTAAIAIPE